MFRKDTSELEFYIKAEYAKIEPVAKEMGVYQPLKVFFAPPSPMVPEGSFCYTMDNEYHYVSKDRGKVKQDKTTYSLFEITYWAIRFTVSCMSSDYERKNREPGKDLRRIMFDARLRLWDAMGGNYRKRAEIEIDEILKENPYEDRLYP